MPPTSHRLLLDLSPAGGVMCEGQGCFTREILGVWSRFADDSHFDTQSLWNRMNQCLMEKSTEEINLWNVSDNAWKGIIDVGIAGGLPGDPWPGALNPGENIWMEFNPTPLIRPDYINDFPNLPDAASNITVLEPCNTLSSIAYIRTIFAFCDYEWELAPEYITGLVQSHNLLWIGSVYFHASATVLGGLLDVDANRYRTLVAHQALLQSIPYDPVLHDFNETAANLTGLEIAAEASRIVTNKPASEWFAQLSALNPPGIEKTFAASEMTILTLIFPSNISVFIFELTFLLDLTEDSLEFLKTRYEPTLRQALENADVTVDFKTKLGLFFKFLGSFIKIFYAFVWQEQTFPFPYNPVTNTVGALSMPKLNKILNKLTRYDRFTNDIPLQISHNVFPGDKRCRKEQYHSLWHEQSANALVDITFAADDVAKVISGKGKPVPFDLRTNLIQCHRESDCLSNFDWSRISAPTSLIFQTCVSELKENGRLQFNTGKFIGCILSSIVNVGNPDAAVNDADHKNNKPHEGTLDQCLVDNDCIGFNGVELDVGRLLKCTVFNIFGPRPPCSSLVRGIPISLCLFACRGDSFCSVQCLQKHANLSPWIDTSLSCLTVFGKSDGVPDENQLEACFREPASDQGSITNEFHMEVVRGLSSLTRCSMQSCDGARREFTQGFGEVNRCTKACTAMAEDDGNESTTDVFPAALPKGIRCALECTVSNVEK